MEEKDETMNYGQYINGQGINYNTMIGQITNTYQSLMDEIDKMNDKLDTVLIPSPIEEETKEEDDTHAKQLMGIKKLWEWFNEVETRNLGKPQIPWSLPHKWDDRQRIVTTGHIVRFLGDMIDKGFWSKEDRIILNYIRELYIVNKGRTSDYITIITNKNFNSK